MSAEVLRQAAEHLTRDRRGSCCINVGQPECHCRDLDKALAAWLRAEAEACTPHSDIANDPKWAWPDVPAAPLAVARAILGSEVDA